MTAPTAPEAPAPARPEPPDADLGLGGVVVQRQRGRFMGRDGRPTTIKYGVGSQTVEKLYLAALQATWTQFGAWLLGGLLLMNGFFAAAWSGLGPRAIAGGEALGVPDPFLRALAFSVGVFTTLGTGALHPVGTTATWLWMFEALVGPLVLVTAAGLLVARLTRPRTRLRFSEGMVVAPYNGGRGLMFRFVNAQPSELTHVQVQVTLARFVTRDGTRQRDFRTLPLERDTVVFFPLHWTVVHPITAASPLAGTTPASLAESEAEFLISVSAHEETFSTRVTARTSYVWQDVAWDARFASVFAHAADEGVAIDVERLSLLDRLPEGTTSVPAPPEAAPQPDPATRS